MVVVVVVVGEAAFTVVANLVVRAGRTVDLERELNRFIVPLLVVIVIKRMNGRTNGRMDGQASRQTAA